MSLIDKFYANEKAAYETLYCVAYAVVAPRLPKRMRYEAEDIVHEGLTTIFADKPRFDSDGELKAYTIKVALTKTVDFCRKQTAKKRGSGDVVSLEDAQNQGLNWAGICPLEEALHQLSTNELRTILINLAATVAEGYRVILYDFYFAELKHEEIAAKRNIPTRNVGTYIERGIKLLRKALKSIAGLKEELLDQLNAPQSVKLILPLIGIFQLKAPDYFDSGEVKYQLAGLEATEPAYVVTTRPVNARQLQPSAYETDDMPSIPIPPMDGDMPIIRILPEDRPVPARMTPERHEWLKTLTVSNRWKTDKAPNASPASASSKGCALLVVILVIGVLLGTVMLYSS